MPSLSESIPSTSGLGIIEPTSPWAPDAFATTVSGTVISTSTDRPPTEPVTVIDKSPTVLSWALEATLNSSAARSLPPAATEAGIIVALADDTIAGGTLLMVMAS